MKAYTFYFVFLLTSFYSQAQITEVGKDLDELETCINRQQYLGLKDRALETFLKVTYVSPSDLKRATFLLGKALFVLEVTVESDPVLQAYLQMSPPATEAEKRQYAEAGLMLAEAQLQRHNRDLSAVFLKNAGNALSHLDDKPLKQRYQKALKEFEKLPVSDMPFDATRRYGPYESRHLDFLVDDPSLRERYKSAYDKVRLGFLAEAGEELELLDSKYGQNTNAVYHRIKSEYHLEKGEVRKSLEYWSKCSAGALNKTLLHWSRITRARIHLYQNEYESAAELYRQVLKEVEEEDYAIWGNELLSIYILTGNREERDTVLNEIGSEFKGSLSQYFDSRLFELNVLKIYQSGGKNVTSFFDGLISEIMRYYGANSKIYFEALSVLTEHQYPIKKSLDTRKTRIGAFMARTDSRTALRGKMMLAHINRVEGNASLAQKGFVEIYEQRADLSYYQQKEILEHIIECSLASGQHEAAKKYLVVYSGKYPEEAEREETMESFLDMNMLKKDYAKAEEYFLKLYKWKIEDIILGISSGRKDGVEIALNQEQPLFEKGKKIFRMSGDRGEIGNWFINHTLVHRSLVLTAHELLESSLRDNPELWERYKSYLQEEELNQRKLNELDASNFFGSTQSMEYREISEKRDQLLQVRRSLLGQKDIQKVLGGVSAYSWRAMASGLGAGEAVIEFVEDGGYYYGIVFRKEFQKPRIVKLVSSRKIRAVSENSFTRNRINSLYTQKFYDQDRTLISPDSLWLPLESHLKKGEKVFYCIPGSLSHIAHAALVSEKYELQQLVSVKNYFENRSAPVSVHEDSPALLIGGLEYAVSRKDDSRENDLFKILNTPLDSLIDSRKGQELMKGLADVLKGNDKAEAPQDEDKDIEPERGIGKGKPAYLPASLEEVKFISSLLKNGKILTGKEATLPKVKQSLDQDILHFATHGFYYPLSQNSNDMARKLVKLMVVKDTFDPTYSQDPMDRTGIIFAEDEASGVNMLTAMEISHWRVPGVQLVVLSACNTALGESTGDDATYGLLKAFKLAGVRYVVLSLWPVPDKETSEFMTLFYTEMIKNRKTIPEGFRRAQQIMKDRYRNEPYKWAAFILAE